MNVITPKPLTVEEFLRWSQAQEGGRYELEGGRIVAMQAENLGHVIAKRKAFEALQAAIDRSGLPFYALPDGPSVRLAPDRAYEPDALAAPLPMPSPEALEVADPIVVVEVLSPTPSSIKRDLTTKVQGYALAASIAHYLVIDPVERTVAHFSRLGDALTVQGEFSHGPLRLDPPGLELAIEALFGGK
ncbi:MAG: Uma2 family endonuclease [Hyphomicrobiaceae bacterium]|nr:Uma2 family endonuclease [Hyphomicrobiaceae bacterium]